MIVQAKKILQGIWVVFWALVSATLCGVGSSCDPRDINYYLPEDIKPLLKDGQVLQFQDTLSGDIDLIRIHSYSKRFLMYSVDKQYTYFNGIKYDYSLTEPSGIHEVFTLTYERQAVTIEFFPEIGYKDETYRLDTSYMLGSIELDSVFKINRENGTGPGPNEVVEIFFSPKYGVVQYSLENGKTLKLKL